MDYTQQLLNNLTKEQIDFLSKMTMARWEQFKHTASKYGKIAALKELYKDIDYAVSRDEDNQITCRKGCSFCCHINVHVYELEVKAIVEYCSEHGIAIPAQHLREQLKFTENEVWKSEHSACVFLKDNLCSIYEVRPGACRVHVSVDNPDICNIKKHGPITVKVARDNIAEFFRSIIDEEGGSDARLPKLLLPYAK